MEKLMDFIENHRRDAILLGLILLIVLILIPVGIVQKSKQKKEKERIQAEYEEQQKEEDGEEGSGDDSEETTAIVQDEVDDEPKESQYKNSLGLDSENGSDGRVVIEEDEEEAEKLEQYEETGLTEPKYATKTEVFDYQKVMETNMDGSKISDYIRNVSYGSFTHGFGSELSDLDFIGNKLYLVGVNDEIKNVDLNIYKGFDFQSVGWLNTNIDTLEANDAITFTNLHVIENLSDTKVSLLCSYSWYSAFGLKDTLVLFEDCSGSLKAKDFKPGDIFSTTAFVHNMKVENNINGQKVINVQYYTFPKDMVVKRPTDLLANSNIAWSGPINFYDEKDTANFAIYWYYTDNETVEYHILYPNGAYNDSMVETELITNKDGSYDLQIIYDKDKSVRASLYKPAEKKKKK